MVVLQILLFFAAVLATSCSVSGFVTVKFEEYKDVKRYMVQWGLWWGIAAVILWIALGLLAGVS